MVDINGLSPEVKKALFAASQEYLSRYGKPLINNISSAYRSTAKQQELWNNRANNPYPVARPGTSPHESGLAIDVNDWQRAKPILEKYGFNQPLPKNDPIHFEFKKEYKQPSNILQVADERSQKEIAIARKNYQMQVEAQAEQQRQAQLQSYLESIKESMKLQLEAEKNTLQNGGKPTPSYEQTLSVSQGLENAVQQAQQEQPQTVYQNPNSIEGMIPGSNVETMDNSQSLPAYEGMPSPMEKLKSAYYSLIDNGLSPDEASFVLTASSKQEQPQVANNQEPINAETSYNQGYVSPLIDTQQARNPEALTTIDNVLSSINDNSAAMDNNVVTSKPPSISGLKALPNTNVDIPTNVWASFKLQQPVQPFQLYNTYMKGTNPNV